MDLRQAVNAPAARGIDTLLVEGGSHLLHELFAAGLVTRIVIKHIPVASESLDAPTYPAADAAGPVLALSRWQVVDWRLIGGVGVSIYKRRCAYQGASNCTTDKRWQASSCPRGSHQDGPKV